MQASPPLALAKAGQKHGALTNKRLSAGRSEASDAVAVLDHPDAEQRAFGGLLILLSSGFS